MHRPRTVVRIETNNQDYLSYPVKERFLIIEKQGSEFPVFLCN